MKQLGEGAEGSGDAMASGADTVRGHVFNVTPEYLGTLGLTLKEGRNFTLGRSTDSTAAVLVNEALVKAFGWEAPLGRPLSAMFAFDDAKVDRGSWRTFTMSHSTRPSRRWRCTWGCARAGLAPLRPGRARRRPRDARAAGAGLARGSRRTCRSSTPSSTRRSSSATEPTGGGAGLIRYAALLAIAIACLGLFGLATLEASRRTKEIGIRKVLGASVVSLAVLLSKDFAGARPRCLRAGGCRLAYLAMRRWLDGFAYRVEIGPGVFLLAGGLALLVALVTVSYQAVKAALADSVESLRYE